MSKKENILKGIPEVDNNARDRFTYWKTPVIEESSNVGGDASNGAGLVAGDITEKDIKAIVDNALTQVDKRTLESDRTGAIFSAVLMSINSLDDGKWQSKVGPEVFDLICQQTDKALTGKKEDKIEKAKDQNEDVMAMAKSAAAPKVTEVTDTGRVKAVPKAKVMKVLQGVPTRARAQVRNQMSGGGNIMLLASLVGCLDKVAGNLQAAGRNDLAEELDKVANAIEASSEGV